MPNDKTQSILLQKEFYMHRISQYYLAIVKILEILSPYIALLILRILLAWEFGQSGYEKFSGENWFTELSFPLPFSLLSANTNWTIATYFELIGAAALLLGFATRFFSLSLMVITVVAILSVHWPDNWHSAHEFLMGYRIIDEDGDGFGNYKLPVIYLAMLIPLVFNGAGKLSLDNLLSKVIAKRL